MSCLHDLMYLMSCLHYLMYLMSCLTALRMLSVLSVYVAACPACLDVTPLPVVTSFYVTVKYLREVTPYFRKASIISEVGWELQRGFLCGTPPRPHSPQRADTRYLPLQLCYLVRNFRHPDPGFSCCRISQSSEREKYTAAFGPVPQRSISAPVCPPPPPLHLMFQDTLLPRRELEGYRAMLPLPNS
uniref:Uncharacterized protein n=1 Tax=Timema tahoe TaxID=61484 RepID=A0A7R9IHE5_9NEOP|nr:unnamed protein product [Timema tahoe]